MPNTGESATNASGGGGGRVCLLTVNPVPTGLRDKTAENPFKKGGRGRGGAAHPQPLVVPSC